MLSQLAEALRATHTIERELGGGGMSRVFLGRETALSRPVVIKVLEPHLVGELSAERFAREIQLAASLQQANIVPLLAAGVAAGLPYFTMPFVEGKSLRETLGREGALPFQTAVSILEDVARALAYAHSRGVVHRDIKPDNVLLSGGTAVVLDFGIAKAITDARGPASSDATLTRAGMSVGTPAYMAPEQAAGEGDVDQRVDVYAWGLLAYELISGHHPFKGRRTALEHLVAHLTIMPANLADEVPDLHQGLASLVMRCLAKDPAERPADGAAIVRELEEADTGLHAAVPRMSRPSNSIAVMPFANLSADPDNEFFADGITEEILNGLASVRGLHVVARTSSFQFKGQRPDLRVVGERLRVRRVLEGSVRRAGSRVRITAQLVTVEDGLQVWSSKYDRELADIFQVQDEIAGDIVAELRTMFDSAVHAVVTPATRTTERHIGSTEAYEMFVRGRVHQDKRVEGIALARQCFEKAIALDPTFAPSHAHLGTVHTYESLYNLRPPRDGFGDARRAAEKALELDPKLQQGHLVLAYVSIFHDWDIATAIGHLDAAERLAPPTAASLIARATTEFAQGHVHEAIQYAEEAVELDPLALEPRINLCMILYFFGYLERAVREADGSLERSIVQSEVLRFKGVSLMNLGRMEEAADVIQRAVDMSYRSVWSLVSLAFLRDRMGDAAAVRGIAAELRERAQSAWVPPLILALVSCLSGDHDEVVGHLMRSLEARDFWLPSVVHDANMVEALQRNPAAAAVFRQVGLPFPA